MKRILLSLSLLLSVAVSAQDTKAFVNHQMATYPQSHLLDIYKSCFQDYMGTEHLVPDHQQAKSYLDEELNSIDIDHLPAWYYEPCGVKSRYVRISLRAVKEGLLTEDGLLDAFVRSANATKHPSVKSWTRKWHKMIGTIDRMNLNLPEYDREKHFIDSILSAGKYAVSHSTYYREAYHPHYRIVERKIFEKELKPLIDRQITSTFIPVQQGNIQEHSPSVFIVTYDAEVGKEPLLKAINEYCCEIVYDYSIIPGMAIKKPDEKTLEETMRHFKTVKGVLTVEYDNIIRLTDPVKPN